MKNLNRIDPLITYALGGVRVIVASKDFPEAEDVLQKHLGTTQKAPFAGDLGPLGKHRPPLQLTPSGERSTDTRSPDIPAFLVIAAFLVLLAAMFYISEQITARMHDSVFHIGVHRSDY